MKNFVLFLLLSLCISTQAQVIGGRGNGDAAPKEVKATEVTSGGFTGDVSLFSGIFNSTSSLGSVTTPSGISFGVSLSYGSTFSSGSNLPHSSGIPYGEGWNVDIPSISVSSEDYNK